ncbi:MAG: Flp family type IVb pilin [Caulobacter sp.]
MGEAPKACRLSDAAGGRPAGRLSARLHLILKAFNRDESGATAIEYGMIASLVFLVVLTSMTAFGNKTTEKMQYVSDAVSAAISGD